MALSPQDEQAFQALTRDVERRPPRSWRILAWVVLSMACTGGVLLAGAMDAPWLAVASWFGLLACCLRTITGDQPSG